MTLSSGGSAAEDAVSGRKGWRVKLLGFDSHGKPFVLEKTVAGDSMNETKTGSLELFVTGRGVVRKFASGYWLEYAEIR